MPAAEALALMIARGGEQMPSARARFDANEPA